MRFLDLSKEEENLVSMLYETSTNSVVRQRCLFVKFSLKKKSMKEISRLLSVSWLTVVRFFNAWESAKSLEEKRQTLGIKEGRGAKVKLEKVADILPDLVKKNSRNLNVVLSILAEKYQINVCKITLQNFLKESKI